MYMCSSRAHAGKVDPHTWLFHKSTSANCCCYRCRPEEHGSILCESDQAQSDGHRAIECNSNQSSFR